MVKLEYCLIICGRFFLGLYLVLLVLYGYIVVYFLEIVLFLYFLYGLDSLLDVFQRIRVRVWIIFIVFFNNIEIFGLRNLVSIELDRDRGIQSLILSMLS